VRSLSVQYTELPIKPEAVFSEYAHIFRQRVLDRELDETKCPIYTQLAGTAVKGWSDRSLLDIENSIREQAEATLVAEKCAWTALGQEPLRPENRALLEFLKEWMSTPDDMGEEWWEQFEQELRSNRLSFRREL